MTENECIMGNSRDDQLYKMMSFSVQKKRHWTKNNVIILVTTALWHELPGEMKLFWWAHEQCSQKVFNHAPTFQSVIY